MKVLNYKYLKCEIYQNLFIDNMCYQNTIFKKYLIEKTMSKNKSEVVEVVQEDINDSGSESDGECEKTSNVATLQLLIALRNEMVAYKNIWYPDNVICKFYKDNAPGKRDFNDWISQINKIIKKTEKYFKAKNPEKKNNIRPTYIKRDLAEFMKSDVISSSTIVTSFMHNYFELNDLCDKKNKSYIIPDSALKKLFWDSLLEREIINENGDLLERDDGCKGFKFTEIQQILQNHYKLEKVKDGKSSKKEKVKRKKPSKISKEVEERLEKERDIQTYIHDSRIEIKKIIKSIENLKKCKEDSKKYGDDGDYDKKIEETIEYLNNKKQELKDYCDEHQITYSKKYFTKYVD